MYAELARVKRINVTWALFGMFLALELAWELQHVSSTMFAISPFAWVHWASPVSPVALVGLTSVAAALSAIGLAGFARRDIGA